MTVFRGLFTRKDSTRGTSPVEARKSLAGIFSRLSSGAPRQGLLSPLTVSGTSGWAYSVPAAQWVTSRGAVDGVVLSGNDGTITVSTSPAPATGSRIDIIYVLNRDVDNADADSEALVGVVSGTASGSPTAPSIPAGAMEVARATVAAANSNTNAATITQTAPMTGLAGADIIVPFELSSFTTRIPNPVVGMRVFSTSENVLYVWTGAWTVMWQAIRTDNVTVNGSGAASGTFVFYREGRIGTVRGVITLASGGSAGTDMVLLTSERYPSWATPLAAASGSAHLNSSTTGRFGSVLLSPTAGITFKPSDTPATSSPYVITVNYITAI